VFVALLALGIVLAAGAVIPPKSFGLQALQNATQAILALAVAAATALIGLWAPAPSSRRSRK
jgi:branched-subunit amino acid permease